MCVCVCVGVCVIGGKVEEFLYEDFTHTHTHTHTHGRAYKYFAFKPTALETLLGKQREMEFQVSCDAYKVCALFGIYPTSTAYIHKLKVASSGNNRSPHDRYK